MKISLSGAGKRFNREWIFRGANLQFFSGSSYAITGPNGSGKSTLLQVLASMTQLSEGKIKYEVGDRKAEVSSQKQDGEDAYKHISFCAPYMELIEEMTLMEFLDFHQQFKPLLPSFSSSKIIAAIGLQAAATKQIRYYSSGMKQRVKLAQAIFSNTEILLLDEPCSNLDVKGIELYQSLIEQHCQNRLVIVCSNDPVEYSFCKETISILDFKSATAPRARPESL